MEAPVADDAACVLVVEDEPVIAELLEKYLWRRGYRTRRAGDGKQALALLCAGLPDLVLLEVTLPKVDGTEVLKRLRANSSVPVVMMTVKAQGIDGSLCLKLGANDYVRNPFRLRDVVARIEATLRRLGQDF